MFPCYKDSYSRIFSLFSQSDADIAVSNRVAGRLAMSGGGVLSKWGHKSHAYWMEVYRAMLLRRSHEDQSAMLRVYLSSRNYPWKLRWLSSNWFWASHGITERGEFIGSATCYRSSVVATGPIKWIHGPPSQCDLMNGPKNSYAYKKRCYYWRQDCSLTKSGPLAVFSREELRSLVFPYRVPPLEWGKTRRQMRCFGICVFVGIPHFGPICCTPFGWKCGIAEAPSLFHRWMFSRVIHSMKAQILKPTAENFLFCSKVLHEGGLVAFPTGILPLHSHHS